MSGHTGHGLHSHFINHHLYLGTEKSAPGENDGGYLKGRRRGGGGGREKREAAVSEYTAAGPDFFARSSFSRWNYVK